MSLLDTAVRWHNDHQRFLEQELPKLEQKWKTHLVDGKILADKLAVAEGRVRAMKSIERREQVAFSQPTAAGTKLARKWMGKMSGWSVYVD
jgi:hypothetical protein